MLVSAPMVIGEGAWVGAYALRLRMRSVTLLSLARLAFTRLPLRLDRAWLSSSVQKAYAILS